MTSNTYSSVAWLRCFYQPAKGKPFHWHNALKQFVKRVICIFQTFFPCSPGRATEQDLRNNLITGLHHLAAVEVVPSSM